MALLKSRSLVLDASAVVRIIEAFSQAVAFQQTVLEAELVLVSELMLTEVSSAGLLRSWITSHPTVTWKSWLRRVI